MRRSPNPSGSGARPGAGGLPATERRPAAAQGGGWIGDRRSSSRRSGPPQSGNGAGGAEKEAQSVPVRVSE